MGETDGESSRYSFAGARLRDVREMIGKKENSYCDLVRVRTPDSSRVVHLLDDEMVHYPLGNWCRVALWCVLLSEGCPGLYR